MPLMDSPGKLAFGVQTDQRITDFARMLFGKEKAESLKSRLARDAAGMFGLKIASTGLFFFINVLLARLLGATGYGAYAYAIAWAGLLGIPAVLGLDRLLVRDMATYQARSAWSLMRGLLRRANQAVLLASGGLTALAALVTWTLAGRFDVQMSSALWVALILLPLMALTRIRQATLQGLHYVVIGQLPEMLIQPILFMAFVGSAYLILGDELMSAPWAVGMNVAAAAFAFLIGARLLRKGLPQAVKEASPAYQTLVWVRSALPLLFVSGMLIINVQADILMLGAMKGAELAGIYAVANQGAKPIAFLLFAANAPLAPTIANLYAMGDMKRLQCVVTKSARVILFFSLPIVLGLIWFGDRFLSLFGQDFIQGKTALVILSIGQLINAAMGSVGVLLTMTGHERDAAIGVGVSAVLNVILNAALIPRWGLEGAASATASSMIVWSLLLAIGVYRRLGIHSTAFGGKLVHRRL